ncbi:MAG: curli production assembly/transport protein CsgG [Deltaproteobacteria bacterium]|nr:curli production assembly/transport protein CsgG [Deltaproteobacteria bacterium]MBW2308607.1 curli production assembly/transport protein CsgG [Deltaproteobacteria bacterium]
MKKAKSIVNIIIVLTIFFLTGCAGPKVKPFTRATLGYLTATQKDLMSLPAPKGKIVVAVYNFRDKTGQYKFLPNVTSFSTAVTQGATSMLIQALKDSNWFIPVEREGFNDLLTERKIIRANNKKSQNDNGLPSLIHAPVLLQGGIVAYETNVSTGGLGAKYFGAGGSGQYRKDQVTIYLRAVNVMQGEIIKCVSSTKSILSAQVDVGLFRFVSFKRLLEVEMGYTTNEPPQLCVLEAINKVVLSLTIEGILDGTWKLKNPEDINAPVIKRYLREKNSRIIPDDRLQSKQLMKDKGRDKQNQFSELRGDH